MIRKLPLGMPIVWESPFWVIMMGVEHQRIHIETSSVIIRRMPIERVRSLADWPVCPLSGESSANRLIPVPGGEVALGKDRNHPLYGWDNEYGRRKSTVQDFRASQTLVSNREYLAFMENGGYERLGYWTEEGRNWVEFAKPTKPLFWISSPNGYKLRTLAAEIDMPWNWPVEVNYLEAKAFCNWIAAKENKPIRLLTEDEWFRLRELAEIPDQPYWPKAPGNINLEYWASSCPVDHFRFGDFCDIIGNVWQWTETPIEGFSGFAVHPCYDDFSTPTFDTRHNLIKGGSWISTGNEATRDARYAFRRHFFQHAGFRYVESSQPLEQPQAIYETDKAVSQYCEAHFGRTYFGANNFPAACAAACLEMMADRPKRRALDLGCSVGRASFELAREFRFVNGLDFSARFIRIAYQMQEKGLIRYALPEEGEIVSYRESRLVDFGLDATASRVEFFQADALNLKPQFYGYDLVLAANLLDRLSDPGKFLAAIHERINDGGLLVLVSPYTWLVEYTPREKWIGGYRKDGEPHPTLEAIGELLREHFDPVGKPRDMEFVIRQTCRKFEHNISQLTVWRKRE
jgi:5-histidylcysteine sulfoxide synthase/putative 4-mercaptohistidine N1-methyltranferase